MSLGILLENQLGTLCFWLFCIKTQMHGSSQIHNCWVHTRDWRFPGGSDGKESICNVGDLDSIPGLGSYPGEGKGYHSRILAWRIPRTIQRVEHNWATFTSLHIQKQGLSGLFLNVCGKPVVNFLQLVSPFIHLHFPFSGSGCTFSALPFSKPCFVLPY